MPTNASAAQAAKAVGNSYVTQRTGEKITWKSPWTFSDTISKVSSDSELVALRNGSTGLLIGYFPSSLPLEAARDELLRSFSKSVDKFETLDRGAYSNVSYSLDKASSGGSTLGIFTLFLDDTGHGATVLYTFLSPIESFSSKMNSAKTKIAVGGSAVFEGVEPGGLQSLLDAGSPSSATSSSASSSSQQSNASKQVGAKTGSYTDPQYGFTVEWGASWNSEGVQANSLFLTSKSKGGIATVAGLNSGGSGISVLSGLPGAWIQSESLIQNARLGNSQYGDDRVTFVVTGSVQGTAMTQIVEVKECPDQSCFVVTRFISPDNLYLSAASDFQRNVTVNGEGALRDLDQMTGA